MTVVVDASLAFKWVVVESDSDLARRFFEERFDGMHAPDFMLIEVMSSLVRRANTRQVSAAIVRAGLREFRMRVSGSVLLHRITPELTGAAAELAITLGHPIGDCVYLALADRLGCPLATSDVKFRDRVADPARVKLLAELV